MYKQSFAAKTRKYIMIGRRRISEETKLRISKANKGKDLGRVPWNKGKN
jgi:hypothetical protein